MSAVLNFERHSQNLAEQAILDDIEYLERQIRELGTAPDDESRAMRRVYGRQLIHRRQMLAACHGDRGHLHAML